MAEPFAQSLAKLGDSGIGVAAAPSGGMGMALTADGKIPAGVLFPGTSALRIAVGTSSVTFTGSAVSAETTIKHGLGVTPVLVGFFPRATIAEKVVLHESTVPNEVNIFVEGIESAGLAVTLTQNIYWIAIG